MQVTELVTLGSDARHLRDGALQHVGGDAPALLRTKTTAALLNWAADEAVRAARPRFRDDYRYAATAAGDVTDLIAHACTAARLPAPPHYRSPEHADRRSGYAVIAPEKREILEAVLVEVARLAADQTEQTLAEIRSAVLDETETSAGRAATSDLLVRDCASLVRHRKKVWDSKLCPVIAALGDFITAAASAALDHRQRGVEVDRAFLANVGAEAIGKGGMEPDILIRESVSEDWGPNLAWLLIDAIAAECWELPPAKVA